MPSHTPPQLSLTTKLFAIPFNVGLLLAAVIRSVIVSPKYIGKWPIRRLFLISFLRARGAFAAFGLRYIGPTTGQLVTDWARKNGIQHASEEIDAAGLDRSYPPFTLHKLSFPTSSPSGLVLVYFHGGGMVRPLNPKGHLPLIQTLAQSLRADTTYIVEYDLAPASPYPTQHVQACSAVQHLLKTIPANRIILAGDSAGGNLVATILAHLQKPSPYTPPIEFDGDFAGSILISPWIRHHPKAAVLPRSITVNAKYDYLWRDIELFFQSKFKPKIGEVWAEPGYCDKGFWRGVRSEKTLVVAGEWEAIRDDVMEFGEKLKHDAGGRVEVVETEKGIHVEAALDLAIGCEGEMLKVLKRWCEEISEV